VWENLIIARWFFPSPSVWFSMRTGASVASWQPK
jgi:hypothetical protein